jgi:hypothetical protein
MHGGWRHAVPMQWLASNPLPVRVGWVLALTFNVALLVFLLSL